jgi:FkbM family methyltransferase
MDRDSLYARLARVTRPLTFLRRGPPHGTDALIDIDRRLTRTTIGLILDVGAHHGESAVRFRRAYSSARILCFEPVPGNLARLRSLEARWRIEVHPYAVSNRDGIAHMALESSRDDMSRLNGTTGLEVQVRKVSTICEADRIDAVDYLKVDTEGHDLDVLRGALPLLQADRISLVELEVGMSCDNTLHVHLHEVMAFLEPLGYRLFGLYEQTLEWLTRHPYLRRTNALFVSPSTIRANHFPEVGA